MSSKKIRVMVTAAFFVALDIIAARYLCFEFPSPLGPIKFDFQTAVAALCGYALGPIWGCLTLVASDLLGVMLNSGSLGMFLGFTISAGMRGLLFGLLLNKKEIKPLKLILCMMAVFIPVDLVLNTVWLSMMVGTPFFKLLIARIIPKLLLMVVEILAILCLQKLFNIVKIKEQ